MGRLTILFFGPAREAVGRSRLDRTVSDGGAGMTAEFIRDRLFKPFQTTKPAGMGIGVYESAQYVNALGGEIRVDSSPGTGTSVRVLLPGAQTTPGAAMLDAYVA